MAKLSREVEKVFSGIRRDIRKAEVSATNKAAVSGVAKTVQHIRSDYNIKSSEMKKDLKHYKASLQNIIYKIRIKHKAKALSKFRARQNKKGVAASIKKGKRKTYLGTFMATMRSGHIGVYKRKGKQRLPIKELYGPSTMELFSSEESKKVLEKSFFEAFKKRFLEEKRRYFG